MVLITVDGFGTVPMAVDLVRSLINRHPSTDDAGECSIGYLASNHREEDTCRTGNTLN